MNAPRQPNQGDVVAYWQLICGIPAAQNPLLDATGEKAFRGQEALKDLVYLSGSNGANRIRNIPDQIPSGSDIFIAVCPVVVTEPEGGTSDTSVLKKFAEEDASSATTVKLTINGQLYDKIPRVPTDPFNVTFPDNGIFCAPKGTFPAVADGYYAIIDGLPSGNNTIEIEAEVAKPFKGFNEAVPWKDKVTYNFKS